MLRVTLGNTVKLCRGSPKIVDPRSSLKIREINIFNVHYLSSRASGNDILTSHWLRTRLAILTSSVDSVSETLAEHFSTPLHFAQKYFGLDATLIPYPSGTGHMITSLQANEIDVGLGLTEGWVAGLGKQGEKAGYKIVGTYVETPLC